MKQVAPRPDLVAVSLFSGAGGLDLGVEEAGFHVLAAIERDPIACRTLERNFRKSRRRTQTHIIEGDIKDVSVSDVCARAGLGTSPVDLLVGGPPCTPFSKSGYWIEAKRKGLDPDRFLLDHYVRFVKGLKPRAFIMENVHSLAYDNHNRSSLSSLCDSLRKLDYQLTIGVLVASEYGVPQVRQRLFIVGAKNGAPLLPAKTHAGPYETRRLFDTQLSPFKTAGEAFEGLTTQPESGEDVGGKWGHLLPEIAPGDNYLHFTAERGHPAPLFRWRSRYWTFLLKLDPSKPSSTIQAQPGPYIGPFHWENRRLRIPELKRLQTFPDDFEFFGNKRQVQKQIGNAVPPKLAEHVARALRKSVFEVTAARRIA